MADTNSIRRDCAVCSSPLSGLKKLYCGNACKVAGWKKNNPEQAKAHRSKYACSGANALRIAIKREMAALRRIAKNWKHRKAKTKKPRFIEVACRHCLVLFTTATNGGLHRLVCEACTDARKRKEKRTRRARHRALTKGCNAENVDPLKVFERDKWRCRLCNVKTPKELRGTYQDNAPELDHIIPLSLGGPHTYANTQCACRKCNGTKSNKPMGQMLLFG